MPFVLTRYFAFPLMPMSSVLDESDLSSGLKMLEGSRGLARGREGDGSRLHKSGAI